MLLAFSSFRESYLVFKVKLRLKLAFSFGCVAMSFKLLRLFAALSCEWFQSYLSEFSSLLYCFMDLA